MSQDASQSSSAKSSRSSSTGLSAGSSGMADKVVIISGASSGIGAELARQLVQLRAKVGLLARREDRLRELRDELAALSSAEHVAYAVADVTDTEGLERALDTLRQRLGPVDVIIANAGYGVPEPPHRHKPGAAMAMYDTNLFGMLRMIDWALPQFLVRGSGHIVGIASLASYQGMPNMASYCGSKAAMRIHLEALRPSLRAYGVAVTTICPGFVESELTARNKAKMPFMWPTDRAARAILEAIEQQRAEFTFPWQMRTILGLINRLPNPLRKSLLAKSTPKKRPLELGD